MSKHGRNNSLDLQKSKTPPKDIGHVGIGDSFEVVHIATDPDRRDGVVFTDDDGFSITSSQ